MSAITPIQPANAPILAGTPDVVHQVQPVAPATYVPSIKWKDHPEYHVLVLETVYLMKIHLKGNKEGLWKDAAHTLNTTKFAGYRPVDGPAYKKQYQSVLKDVKHRYAIDKSGSNVSALDEDAPELDIIAMKILREMKDKLVSFA